MASEPHAENCRNLDRYRGQKITRQSSLRLRCLDCRANVPSEVRKCEFTDCPSWPYRMGGSWEDPGLGGKVGKNAAQCKALKAYKGQKVTRSSAIRLYCLSCCGDQSREVRLCPACHCPHWPYRTGGAWDNPLAPDAPGGWPPDLPRADRPGQPPLGRKVPNHDSVARVSGSHGISTFPAQKATQRNDAKSTPDWPTITTRRGSTIVDKTGEDELTEGAA